MEIEILKGSYSIYRFEKGTALPQMGSESGFYSVTHTEEELSVIALQSESLSGFISSDCDWRILKIRGPLDLAMIGIIAEISLILRDKRIPIFVLSTYLTDYFLLKEPDLGSGIRALTEKGYIIRDSGF